MTSFFDHWYFGKDERDLFGRFIADLCDGWVISKRVSHCDAGEEFSLASVAELLKQECPECDEGQEEFDLYTVLGALEGMCHNNEAVEVADGFYYVGSYQDWHTDVDAQNRLDELIEADYE